ncbi:pentatricopeptide repeat-containing protein At2g33680-like [Papaver somniferum]|uniref:pentatricopeptide repeat-containing protein At2g33680-like n=1 Tax=Papaver somniferum TaxID=3469 RepID=UPI000E6FF2A4|nr:pentatricopeptide repeat-containing protein At2g33680-like [Papaver somniferum]
MEKRDVVSWTMMITGFGQHGKGKEAIDILRMMLSEGFKPDDITLLGGRLKEAEIFIQQTGVGSEVFVWEALLGACSIHGELELGERSAEKIMKLEPRRNQPTCYWRIYMLIGDYGRTRKRSERAWVSGARWMGNYADLAFELSGARNISPTVPGGSLGSIFVVEAVTGFHSIAFAVTTKGMDHSLQSSSIIVRNENNCSDFSVLVL